MSSLTANYSFTKPAGTENYTVAIVNANNDAIDAAIKDVSDYATAQVATLTAADVTHTADIVAINAKLPITKTGTVTTDASGFATVTHSIGVLPVNAIFTLNGATGSLYGHWFVDTYTTTTVRVRVADMGGALLVSGNANYRATYFFN